MYLKVGLHWAALGCTGLFGLWVEKSIRKLSTYRITCQVRGGSSGGGGRRLGREEGDLGEPLPLSQLGERVSQRGFKRASLSVEGFCFLLPSSTPLT